MKRFMFVAMALFVMLNAVGCALAESTSASAPSEAEHILPTPAQLLGTWQAVDGAQSGLTELVFLPDGTMTAQADGNSMTPAPFTARGGLLIALMSGKMMAIKVSLKDEATLLFDGSEFTRTRVNAGALTLTNSLLGVWASEDTEGLTFQFERDGTYRSQMNGVDVLSGVYLATDNMLLYSESDVVYHQYNYRCNIDGTLQFEEDGEKKLQFRRIEAPSPLPVQTLAGQLMGSWHSSSNGADMTVTYRPDGIMEVANTGDAPSEFAYCVRGEYQASVLFGDIVVSRTSVLGDVMRMEDFSFQRTGSGSGELHLDNELIGIWQNDEGIGEIEFRSDGTTYCQGVETSYAIAEAGKLLLLFDQGFANLNDYSIDDDALLTLTIEGNTSTFKKKGI